jgi:hypothetical protein
MKERLIKLGLVLGVIVLTFLYFNYDKKIIDNESVSIANVDVYTKELGDVSLIDNNLNYNINFNKVGDEFVFSFDIRNDTMFDMNINKVSITGLNDWIDFKVIDEDGKIIRKNMIIKKNTFKKVFVSLKYVQEINSIEDVSWQMGIDVKVSRI